MIGWERGYSEIYDDFGDDVLTHERAERADWPTAPLDTAIRLIVLSGSSGLFFAIFFSVFPSVDLQLAELFFVKSGVFVGHQPFVELIRACFQTIFVTACAAAIVCGTLSIMKTFNWRGWSGPKWFFLAACLSIGPGIVANVMLKDQWGRARPKQVAMLGGEKEFTPALLPGKQCERNCSFVSGEASSMFAVFFALALLIGGYSSAMFSLGLATGLGAGLIRMMQGAHFLSDVLFAGVFMALTVGLIYVYAFPVSERRVAWQRTVTSIAFNSGLYASVRST